MIALECAEIVKDAVVINRKIFSISTPDVLNLSQCKVIDSLRLEQCDVGGLKQRQRLPVMLVGVSVVRVIQAIRLLDIKTDDEVDERLEMVLMRHSIMNQYQYIGKQL